MPRNESPPPSAPTKASLVKWWTQFTNAQKFAKYRDPHKPLSDDEDHPVFGKPLRESLRYASVQISTANANGSLYVWGYIPVVVAKCGLYLKENATEVQGTFRVSGSTKRMRDLQMAFETPPRYGKNLDWKKEQFTTHDVASVFRRYLTQMPEPVIPHDLYHHFRDALAKQPCNHEEVIATYKKLIQKMPRANQYLLLYVLDLLSVFARKSDKNLMNATNLAVIFRPGLISHPNHELTPHEHALSQRVLEFLIEQQDWFLLDIPPPPTPTAGTNTAGVGAGAQALQLGASSSSAAAPGSGSQALHGHGHGLAAPQQIATSHSHPGIGVGANNGASGTGSLGAPSRVGMAEEAAYQSDSGAGGGRSGPRRFVPGQRRGLGHVHMASGSGDESDFVVVPSSDEERGGVGEWRQVKGQGQGQEQGRGLKKRVARRRTTVDRERSGADAEAEDNTPLAAPAAAATAAERLSPVVESGTPPLGRSDSAGGASVSRSRTLPSERRVGAPRSDEEKQRARVLRKQKRQSAQPRMAPVPHPPAPGHGHGHGPEVGS